MGREQFFHGQTAELLSTLDEAARRSGVSRGQAFEDFLHMVVCTLSGGAMEDEYLSVVQKHAAGPKGKRGCDALAQLFGRLVDVMEETRADILGDLFQGAITYGEAGQFLTPENVTKLMADLTLADTPDDSERRTACDPCCGSGRMLLAVTERCPHWEVVGQDIDLRCVRMAAVNLALRNRYGYVIWGNSLAAEQRLVYRTGFNLRGFVRECPLADCPAPVQHVAAELPAGEPPASDPASETPASTVCRDRSGQLRFF